MKKQRKLVNKEMFAGARSKVSIVCGVFHCNHVMGAAGFRRAIIMLFSGVVCFQIVPEQRLNEERLHRPIGSRHQPGVVFAAWAP